MATTTLYATRPVQNALPTMRVSTGGIQQCFPLMAISITSCLFTASPALSNTNELWRSHALPPHLIVSGQSEGVVRPQQYALVKAVIENARFETPVAKLTRAIKLLGISNMQAAAILRVSRQTLHNWASQNRTEKAVLETNQRSLSAFLQFAVMWNDLGPELDFSPFTHSLFDGKTIADILEESPHRTDLLSSHVNGLLEIAQKRINASMRLELLASEGFEISYEIDV